MTRMRNITIGRHKVICAKLSTILRGKKYDQVRSNQNRAKDATDRAESYKKMADNAREKARDYMRRTEDALQNAKK